MNRTKIAIIGADISAFHLFNTVYRSDDRYEVACFVAIYDSSSQNSSNIRKYPACYAGSLYPQGILIMQNPAFQTHLSNSMIEKCIFAPSCVTTSQYLYLAAQCMAAQCSVISPSLELTRLSPPKALVSFFSDTQFDIPILIHILDTYKSNFGKTKPAVIMPGPVQRLPHENSERSILLTNRAELEQYSQYLTRHQKEMCEKLIFNKYPVYLVYDFERFSTEAYRTDTFNLIVFVGFNSLPCYFNSHLTVYACDEFTFPSDISEHPSSVLCRQADIILYAEIIPSKENVAKLAAFSQCDKIIPLQITYNARNQSCYPNKTALLVDDGYPARECNAARSISEFLAKSNNMKSLIIDSTEMNRVVANSPIYSEPTEKHWPAIILPDSIVDVTMCNENLEKYTGYDLIVSTTNEPCPLKSPKPTIPIMQFSFKLQLDSITPDLLSLPPWAFVKQRKG